MMEILQERFAGKWVALREAAVIASGTRDECKAAAAKYPSEEVWVLWVPPKEGRFVACGHG